jgi:hypothetical protein
MKKYNTLFNERIENLFEEFIIPPANKVWGVYLGITLSVRPSIHVPYKRNSS